MKKKLIHLVFAFLLCFQVLGQTTVYPRISNTNVPNCRISGIDITETGTYVYLECEITKSTKYQAWVAISSATYIRDRITEGKYLINRLGDNMTLDTQYGIPDKKGAFFNITMIFPKLPPGVSSIDIIEPNGFVWEGITINNPYSTAISFKDTLCELNQSQYSEIEFKEILIKKAQERKLDPIEGIWAVKVGMNYYDKFGKLLDAIQGSGNTITIGILNSENRYLVYDLNPEPNKYNSGVFTKTASPGTYLFEFEDKSKNLKTRSTAKLSGIGTLYYSFEPLSNTELKKTLGSGFRLGNKFIVENEATKIFPISDELAKYSKSTSSGTCFALSSDGLLITNYHVVKNSEDIKVYGINGEFQRPMNAEILLEDKNNDLVILKIIDSNFDKIEPIPYTLNLELSDVGESISVLGYPLRSSMGDEIKLTTGIISSRTGFQGDISSYQLSAPVQPGSSGGPVFNQQGLLIGIISAKHLEADNATYAVKASYLKSLTDLLPSPIKHVQSSTLKTLSLSEQIKILKKFVYIIEAK